MSQKPEYNIRVAGKKRSRSIEDSSDETFEEYLRLTKETTTRQIFTRMEKDITG